MRIRSHGKTELVQAVVAGCWEVNAAVNEPRCFLASFIVNKRARKVEVLARTPLSDKQNWNLRSGSLGVLEFEFSSIITADRVGFFSHQPEQAEQTRLFAKTSEQVGPYSILVYEARGNGRIR